MASLLSFGQRTLTTQKVHSVDTPFTQGAAPKALLKGPITRQGKTRRRTNKIDPSGLFFWSTDTRKRWDLTLQNGGAWNTTYLWRH